MISTILSKSIALIIEIHKNIDNLDVSREEKDTRHAITNKIWDIFVTKNYETYKRSDITCKIFNDLKSSNIDFSWSNEQIEEKFFYTRDLNDDIANTAIYDFYSDICSDTPTTEIVDDEEMYCILCKSSAIILSLCVILKWTKYLIRPKDNTETFNSMLSFAILMSDLDLPIKNHNTWLDFYDYINNYDQEKYECSPWYIEELYPHEIIFQNITVSFGSEFIDRMSNLANIKHELTSL